MALLKVQQGTEVHIAGECLMESIRVPNRDLLNAIRFPQGAFSIRR
jgi:hypothetical protein